MANPTGFRHFILYDVSCQQVINRIWYITQKLRRIFLFLDVINERLPIRIFMLFSLENSNYSMLTGRQLLIDGSLDSKRLFSTYCSDFYADFVGVAEF